MEIHENVLNLIGNTPLVRLNKITHGVRATVLAKLEFLNPGGSVKDRIGLAMIEEAEREGRLKPGGTVIEGTSGNTGVGLAIAAAIKGYRCIFVMPDKMSDEKVQLLRAFGARVVITPTAVEPDDPRSYYSVSKRLVEETPNAILAGQYWNRENPEAHYRTTGPEIWKQTGGSIDYLVCGIGTGGTITGTAKFLKEQNPAVKVIGVDPIGSLIYDTFKAGGKIPPGAFPKVYKVEGIGEDFLPDTLDFQYIDDVVQVGDRDSFLTARRLVREEGLFCGGSSGTAVYAALQIAKHLEDETIVVILPDSGSRYLSKVFNDDWMRENRFLDYPLAEGRVQDILQLCKIPVITAHKADRKTDVIERMRENGVSQLPVVEDGNLYVGMVTEVDLLNHLLSTGHTHSQIETIADIINPEAAGVVGPETSLAYLSEVFRSGKVAVVCEGARIVGIVSKIDLIEYLAGRLQ